MRIISGQLKGTSIHFLKDKSTRPLKDSVKENIFNILIHSNVLNVEIHNSNVLDLYSGIGSLGLECISRGADKVTFVEESKIVSNLLKKNLKKMSIFSRARILEDNIDNALIKIKNESYNIFFLDPPFKDIKFVNSLEILKRSKVYKTRHIVIIHREIETKDNLEKFLNILIVKKYRRSKIIFGTFN